MNIEGNKIYDCPENGRYATTMPIAATGLEGMYSPFLQFNTGQRTMMFSSNLWQALVTNGAEYPRWSSGLENQTLRYSFNESSRDDDVIVYEAIPKYISGAGNVRTNPETILIYTHKGEADYCIIGDYTPLYNGFGYMNCRTPMTMFANLGRGTPLDKSVVLVRPPNHIDKTLSGPYGDGTELLCQGINANILYTTMPHAAEDAIVVSHSYANKGLNTAIHTAKIALDDDEIPLNLYGSSDEPRVFPDIGCVVNDDNILMAIRKKTKDTFSALASSPQRVLISDDRTIYAPAGSQVLNVQIYMNPRTYSDYSKIPGVMTQIIEYMNTHYKFYGKICKVYEELVADGYRISPYLNDLITNALVLNYQKNPILLLDGKKSIRNCIIEITYKYSREVSVGAKISGRSGDKAIIASVWPDEWMPVDEQGIRADIVASPETVCNRLNEGQSYEAFYNRLCTLVTQRLCKGEYGEGLKAYDVLMEFIGDISQRYAEQLQEQLPTKQDKLDFVDEVKLHGIYIVSPPFNAEITLERAMFVCKKWKYVRSPVTFSYELGGGKIKTFTTKQPMSIGSKYTYVLSKIPKMQMLAHTMSHVNQFGIPVKGDSKVLKLQYATSPTPIRFGEDEIGLLSMLRDPERPARFIMMRSGSRAASELLCETILASKNPSNICAISMSTMEMIKRSETISLFCHMMGVVGFDLGEDSTGRA